MVLGNEAAVKMYGFDSPEDALGVNPLDFVHPDDRERVLKLIVEDMFKKDLRTTHDIRTMTKDGTEKWVSAVGARTEYEGRLAGLISIRDITERKRAEEHLKQYKFMVESAHDAIFFKDLESRYLIANTKALEAFGLSREEVIGKNDYELMPNRQEAKKNVEDDQLVFKAAKRTQITKHMISVDGKEYWFEAVKVPQLNDKGDVIGLIGIARDITERKQAEEERQQGFYRLMRTLEGTVRALASMVEMKDPYTAGHQRGVTQLACAIAK